MIDRDADRLVKLVRQLRADVAKALRRRSQGVVVGGVDNTGAVLQPVTATWQEVQRSTWFEDPDTVYGFNVTYTGVLNGISGTATIDVRPRISTDGGAVWVHGQTVQGQVTGGRRVPFTAVVAVAARVVSGPVLVSLEAQDDASAVNEAVEAVAWSGTAVLLQD